jgi:eukaryotic-like serine/threonine-protein kinase
MQQSMTPEQWQRTRHLLNEALQREPARRAGFLTEVCAGDDALRRDLEALLIAHEQAGSFLESPALPEFVLPTLGISLRSGSLLGGYEIRNLIGIGGMGEVYRARDIRLERDVAIKIVAPAFTGDSSRLTHFEHEARVLASLNHAHIGGIYGITDAVPQTGIPLGLVLELVEGETLTEWIARHDGPKSRASRLDELLTLAVQIATGVEAAHEKGIIHLDLKPGNIKITPEGVVKILDFGLAKAVSGQESEFTAASGGLLIGTAAYMSPEQTERGSLDRRADIWAFGCILYEMLTARAAFARESIAKTLTAVVEQEPDWLQLPASATPDLHRLLQRCLQKEPKQRLRDIGDARYELDRIIETLRSGPPLKETQRARTTSFALLLAVLVAALGLATAVWLSWVGAGAAADHRIMRFTIELPKGQVITPGFNPNLALSPDGMRLAFTPFPGPVSIRRLDSLETVPLEVSASSGFRGAPVFSPDGTSISYIEGNAIYSWSRPFLKASLSGGAAVKLADYDAFHRGDWGEDGNLYWTATYPGAIVRISAAGGDMEPVTTLDVQHGERSHRFAELLPGGQALIYTVALEGISSYDDARIDLWDLNTHRRKQLINGATMASYSPSGHIVYARTGKLFAVPFDLKRREVTGSAFEVLDEVMMSRNTGAAHFTISKRGDLAYVPGSAEGGDRTLVWVDRSGKAEPLPLPPASYLYPRISPDGRLLAVEIEGPNHDFYVYDFARTVLSKMTTDGLSHAPVWTPDGQQLAFRSWQAGGMTMWLMPADRRSKAVRLDPTGTRQNPVSFSPDGKFLAFDQKDSQNRDDAWILPIDGTVQAQPIARSRFGEGSAKFSPDGRWIAYSSNESGKAEIYVQPFPGLGPKLQISSAGGTDPVWRRSGGELYYRNGNKMMVVSATTFPRFQASPPEQLWEGNYSDGSGASCGMPGVSSSNYDVTPDGQHFLMVRDDDRAGASRIIVVVNWAEEVKAKAEKRNSQK